MKLFDGFEAVKFFEENLIFITHNGYLYYIYNPKHKIWRRHNNAGNDYITVENYDDISKEELMNAMNGVFPQKRTDFTRLLNPKQLYIGNMIDLLEEDYVRYMSEHSIRCIVQQFLKNSNILHKSYLELRKLFDDANSCCLANEQVSERIKELSFKIIGRDIFKEEIRIVDGHNSSSYFWIMPVRIIDYSNTDMSDNVAEMKSVEISIEEDDVWNYLTPFLYKYFDKELEANKKRIEQSWTDNNGNTHTEVINDFECNLTHNFYTFESIENILKDIGNTIEALSSGSENEFTEKLKGTKAELVIDFYHRFTYRMEYMMRVGKEKGYNLISFMGP